MMKAAESFCLLISDAALNYTLTTGQQGATPPAVLKRCLLMVSGLRYHNRMLIWGIMFNVEMRRKQGPGTLHIRMVKEPH